MPLSADQQAMLQLLLERGQRYEDLASVLGVDEAEVRSRARQALTELAGNDPDRNVGLTDYLLGQADPIGRADAVRHLKDDPEDLSLATEISQKLLLLAPGADLPRLPGEERRPRAGRRSGSSTGRKPILGRVRGRGKPKVEDEAGRTTLTRRQAQLFVLLGCGAVLLVVGVLAVTGTFSGGGGDEAAGTTTTASTRTLATVELKPQANTNAAGAARFGLNGQQAFVDVGLRGLKPAPSGQTYVIWLLLTPDKGYPLSPIRTCGSKVPQPCLSKAGTYENRFELPSATLAIVSRTHSVDVSVAPTDAVRSSIQSAIQQNQLIIQRPGTSVLSGTIPKASRPTGGGNSSGGG